jgi:hypothetical protein
MLCGLNISITKMFNNKTKSLTFLALLKYRTVPGSEGSVWQPEQLTLLKIPD